MPVISTLLLGLSSLGINLKMGSHDRASKRIAEWSKLRPSLVDDFAAPSAQTTPVPSSHLLNAGAPNSASLFLYGPSAYAPSEDGEIFYLPLGQRVYTDEHGSLPAHPQFGRIVEITESVSTRKIECFAYPYVVEEASAFRVQGDMTPRAHIPASGQPIRFDFEDGLVNFAAPTSRWFLDGQQIESYECR